MRTYKTFIPYNDYVDPPKPVFEHDCTGCKFVGNIFSIKGEKVERSDVYVCKETVIWRHSSDGPDYMSFRVKEVLHCILHPNPTYMDSTWLIQQLKDAGILKFHVAFKFNLRVQRHTLTYNFKKMRVGDEQDFCFAQKKAYNAMWNYNSRHKDSDTVLVHRTEDEILYITKVKKEVTNVG